MTDERQHVLLKPEIDRFLRHVAQRQNGAGWIAVRIVHGTHADAYEQSGRLAPHDEIVSHTSRNRVTEIGGHTAQLSPNGVEHRRSVFHGEEALCARARVHDARVRVDDDDAIADVPENELELATLVDLRTQPRQAQRRLHARQELGSGDRLRQVVVGTRFEAAHAMIEVTEGRHHDDGNGACALVIA